MKPIIALGGLVETVTPGSLVEWYALPQSAPNATGGADRITCFVGRASGGVPNRPYFFTDVAVARRVLGSGELLRAVQRALTQSPRPRGVLAVNPVGGTPATFEVEDAAGDAVVTLTTRTFREPANQAHFSLTGAAATGFRIEITDPLTGAKLVSNRVGLGLYLSYTGTGTAATAQVAVEGGVKVLKTTVTGAAADSLTIPLDGHTVQSLGQRIQELGPYKVMLARDGRLDAATLDVTAQPVDIMTYALVGILTANAAQGATTLTVSAITRAVAVGETLRLQAGGSVIPVRVAAAAAAGATSLTVDPISRAAASGAGLFNNVARAQAALTATKGDLVQYLRTRAGGIVDFAVGASTQAPKVQSGFFSGGLTLADGAADWETSATAALAELPFSTFAPLTDNRAVVYGLRAMIQGQRTPQQGRWIQFFDGTGADFLPEGDSEVEVEAFLGDVSTEVASINDHDTLYVPQSLEMVDPQTGEIRAEPPYMVAAMLAAVRAGIGIGETLTYRTVNGTNPFPNLSARRDDFVRAGALVLEAPRRGQAARVVLGRTAYVGEDNTVYESEKQVATMNAIARDVRTLQDALVPGAGTPAKLGEYKTALEDYFESRVEKGWIQAGIDENGQPVPAFEYVVGRTSQYGRLVTTKSTVNPVGEFLVAEHRIAARAVDVEV